jgi:hypothetical protein
VDDLEAIRRLVPAYADYTDEEARHLADTQVRAWVGEALSRARERIGAAFDARLGDQFDELLLLCEFTDQVLMRTLNHLTLDAVARASVHAADRALFDAATRADGFASTDGFAAFLTELRGLFADRTHVIEALRGSRPRP